jgi:hypothetical protein
MRLVFQCVMLLTGLELPQPVELAQEVFRCRFRGRIFMARKKHLPTSIASWAPPHALGQPLLMKRTPALENPVVFPDGVAVSGPVT